MSYYEMEKSLKLKIGELENEREHLKSKLNDISKIAQELIDGHDPEITIDTRQCLEFFDKIKAITII